MRSLSNSVRWGLLAGLFLIISACTSDGNAVMAPIPTNTPMPTFTPTPEIVVVPVDPAAAAAAATAAAQQAAPAEPAPVQPAPEQPAEPAPEQPAQPDPPTPEPAQPSVVTGTAMNVRGGPGTNYNIIGSTNAGQRFTVTGRNQAGDWWQINFNNQSGWLYGPLVTTENTGGVQVAANIPPPPAPTNTPVPPPPPPPTAVPEPPPPTQPPAPRYEFNIAVVGECRRQPAGTWFEGRVYRNGQPSNGHLIVFSYAPDGPWVTQPQTSGPHEGYLNWDAGYYSHIISASGPIAGTWYVWIVDGAGNRISEMASWTSTGPGEACNDAVVDFDSR